MASGKIYDFAFNLVGKLDPGFAQSVRAAQGAVKNSNATIQQLENSLNQMEAAYKAGTLSAKSFAAAQDSINAKINKESAKLEQLVQQQEQYQQIQAQAESFSGGLGAVGAGLAAGVGLGVVLQQVDAYQQAMGQAQAMTGAVGEGWQEIQAAVNSTYVAGFGADINDVATATGQVRQIIGDIGDELDNATQHAILLRDTFGMEVTESARAAKVMMEQFGVSEQQAYTLMAQGAQLGADKNGDLLDTLNEYSVQFQQLGFDAEGFMNIVVAGAQSGVWSVDKIGDAIKEFGIRVKDGSDTTKEGFQAIGLDADEMAQKFAAGGETAQQAFYETIMWLENMEDPVARNQAGVALFGTMWEDMGEKAIFAMADVNNAVDMNAQTLDDIANSKMANFSTAMSQLGRSIEVSLVAPLAEAATPAVQAFADIISSIDPDTLVAAIAGIGAAVAAFQVGSLIAGIGSIGTAFAAAGAAIAAISWPIVAAAAAIGLLVAAGVMLYKNWDTVTEYASSAWERITAAFSSGVDMVSSLWDGFINLLSSGFDLIGAGVDAFINGFINMPQNIAYAIGFIAGVITQLPTIIMNAVTAAGTWLMNLPSMCMSAGSAFIASLTAWLSTTYTTAVEWFSNTVASVQGIIVNLPAICASVGAEIIGAVTAWASGAYNAVVDWIGRIPDIVSNAIANAASAVSSFISGLGDSFSGGFNAGSQIPANAEGGIYRQGAFLTTFAERSPEAAIPIDGSRRAVNLWQKAGSMLGVYPESGIVPSDFSAFGETSSGSTGSVNVSFAPNIVINGNADKTAVQSAIDDEFAKFKAYMARFQREQRRVSYA